MQVKGLHNHSEPGQSSSNRSHGIDTRLRNELEREWRAGNTPENALNAISERYSSTFLKDVLPTCEQVRNLWVRLRKRQEKSGFSTCSQMRLHPHYQLPQCYDELSVCGDGDIFATWRAPVEPQRWGIGLISKSMIERLDKYVPEVRRYDASMVLSCDATLKVLRNVQSHALLVVGFHRLKLDGQQRSAHSFVPLLFYLCDAESKENYRIAFQTLEELSQHYFGSTVSPNIVRGDHHAGLVNAVQDVWPNVRFIVCRTHACQSVREHSRGMNAHQRETWLRIWRLLEQSGTQFEFDALAPLVVSLLSNGFDDKRAASVLQNYWTSTLFGTWHVSPAGVPYVPPDNIPLESYQRVIGRYKHVECEAKELTEAALLKLIFLLTCNWSLSSFFDRNEI